MDAVESSAGQSATSRAVRQPTTGWRTRWWTAAQAARFASPSLSDATTAGTVGSSSARSAVASNQRSKGWRSRHRWEFVRTVTTTCNTSEALRTAAETELLRQKRNTSWGLEDLRSFSFLHLPCSTLYSSHISQNKNPLYPPVRPVTTCTVTHWQTVTRRENVVLFITTAVKFSEGGGKKWAWKKTGGEKNKKTTKLNHHFYHLHSSPDWRRTKAKAPLMLRHVWIKSLAIFAFEVKNREKKTPQDITNLFIL